MTKERLATKVWVLTFKKLSEICKSRTCIQCPFYQKGFSQNLPCGIINKLPAKWQLADDYNDERIFKQKEKK